MATKLVQDSSLTSVANANAFSNPPSDLVVYVPAGTLSAYQNAMNYTNIKDYMVEMTV